MLAASCSCRAITLSSSSRGCCASATPSLMHALGLHPELKKSREGYERAISAGLRRSVLAASGSCRAMTLSSSSRRSLTTALAAAGAFHSHLRQQKEAYERASSAALRRSVLAASCSCKT